MGGRSLSLAHANPSNRVVNTSTATRKSNWLGGAHTHAIDFNNRSGLKDDFTHGLYPLNGASNGPVLAHIFDDDVDDLVLKVFIEKADGKAVAGLDL